MLQCKKSHIRRFRSPGEPAKDHRHSSYAIFSVFQPADALGSTRLRVQVALWIYLVSIGGEGCVGFAPVEGSTRMLSRIPKAVHGGCVGFDPVEGTAR